MSSPLLYDVASSSFSKCLLLFLKMSPPLPHDVSSSSSTNLLLFLKSCLLLFPMMSPPLPQNVSSPFSSFYWLYTFLLSFLFSYILSFNHSPSHSFSTAYLYSCPRIHNLHYRCMHVKASVYIFAEDDNVHRATAECNVDRVRFTAPSFICQNNALSHRETGSAMDDRQRQ